MVVVCLAAHVSVRLLVVGDVPQLASPLSRPGMHIQGGE